MGKQRLREINVQKKLEDIAVRTLSILNAKNLSWKGISWLYLKSAMVESALVACVTSSNLLVSVTWLSNAIFWVLAPF